MLLITVGFRGGEMSMLSISSHMCSQTTHNTSSSPGSTLFFSYMRMVVYVNFRTLMSDQQYKLLILLNTIRFHNGCNIQREYNNASSERKKINLSELAKVTLTPLPPFTYRGRSYKNIFRNHGDKS
jgi:hypothetical protein